jgi:hypothetical protein
MFICNCLINGLINVLSNGFVFATLIKLTLSGVIILGNKLTSLEVIPNSVQTLIFGTMFSQHLSISRKVNLIYRDSYNNSRLVSNNVTFIIKKLIF